MGRVGAVGGDVGRDGGGGEPVVEVGEVGGGEVGNRVFGEAVDQGVEVFIALDVAEEEGAVVRGERGKSLKLGDHGVEGSGVFLECKRGKGKMDGADDMTLSAGFHLICSLGVGLGSWVMVLGGYAGKGLNALPLRVVTR